MHIFRPKHDNLHDNIAASPVRALYGRKGGLLLAPLDLCVLLVQPDGGEEFRTSLPPGRFLAAPVQEAAGGRIGLIAGYDWPPPGKGESSSVNPVVLVQAAPSVNIRGIADRERIAAQAEVEDAVHLGRDDEGDAEGVEGVVRHGIGPYPYPDLAHQVSAYRVEFGRPVPREAHGSPVYLGAGGGAGDGAGADLLGMLIATDNRPDGTCRALVYPV